jgi:hypothetical protein
MIHVFSINYGELSCITHWDEEMITSLPDAAAGHITAELQRTVARQVTTLLNKAGEAY